MTTCEVNYNAPIRRLFFLTPQSTLETYNILPQNYLQIGSNWYLVFSVADSNYTRIEEGNRSQLISTRTGDIISPQLLKVGFTAKIENQNWNVFQCISFLAMSSLSTSYYNYTPVNVLDYVRPEITDVTYTSRVGKLSVINQTGTSGSASGTNAPVFGGDFDINFMELNRRLIA